MTLVVGILLVGAVVLVGDAAPHHIRRMVRRVGTSLHHDISTNSNIIFFNDSDSILTTKLLVHALAVILLGLDDVASQHLRIFNFNLWIIENVIVVIDIFNYLNWLVALLFLGL